MTLEPILYAPVIIQIHVAAAAATLALTLVILSRARGTRSHRRLGWAWVLCMGVLAATGFGILSGGLIGPFGPIHPLSALVLMGLVVGVRAARRHDVATHRGWMLGMVWGGLVIAGGFTLLPGRIMHVVVFGG